MATLTLGEQGGVDEEKAEAGREPAGSQRREGNRLSINSQTSGDGERPLGERPSALSELSWSSEAQLSSESAEPTEEADGWVEGVVNPLPRYSTIYKHPFPLKFILFIVLHGCLAIYLWRTERPAFLAFVAYSGFNLLFFYWAVLVHWTDKPFGDGSELQNDNAFGRHLAYLKPYPGVTQWMRDQRLNEAPLVDVIIPRYREDTTLLAHTLAYAKRIDYEGRFFVWVLDDGHDVRQGLRSVVPCSLTGRARGLLVAGGGARAGGINERELPLSRAQFVGQGGQSQCPRA